MARTLLVLNWKMNPERLADAEALFTATKKASRISSLVGLVVCPPTLFLGALRKKYDGTVLLGAQDVYGENTGAHTGAISPNMLESLGVKYVIVGHSERRRDGETNDVVAKKVSATLVAHLTPIVCVGEHERDEKGSHFAFLEEQITASLKNVGKARAKNLVIAYEPLWAIGKTYKAAIDAYALHETTIFIRKILARLFGRTLGMSIKILYGGSVESGNAGHLMKGTGIAGYLIGHASLDADELKALIQSATLYVNPRN